MATTVRLAPGLRMERDENGEIRVFQEATPAPEAADLGSTDTIPEGFELETPSNSYEIPPGFELESKSPVQEKGGLAQDLQKRGANLSNIINATKMAPTKSGEQTPGEAIYQGAMNEVGAAGDVIGRGLEAGVKGIYNALPQGARQAIDAGLNKAAEVVGPIAQQYNENVEAYNAQNPRAGRNFEATRQLLNFIPIPGLNKSLAGVATDVLTAIPKKAFAQKALPRDYQSLDALVKSGGPTAFSKKPNDIDLGSIISDSISSRYDASKARTNQADKLAREIGKKTPIPAAEVYENLDRIIGSLQGKVAPGTKEGSVLDQLTTIRDNLVAKNPIVRSSAGEKSPPRTILPSDLMDIERTINQGLPENKFLTSGAGKALNFKQTVKDAIDQASKINPEFGKKYKDYKKEATDLMEIYQNDTLKNYWQPEDYVSWKANQNNPEARKFSKDTLNRINNILDNLNTSKLGNIQAVIDALPPERAQELMRAAFVKAKKEKTGFKNAFINLITGRLPTGLEMLSKSVAGKTGGRDMVDAMRNLKKMQSGDIPPINKSAATLAGTVYLTDKEIEEIAKNLEKKNKE